MNPPSQPAPQTRAFQSWQLVFITVMLLAAVTSGLYIATVQAESNGAELLFEVFSQRYERGSVLVTTNLPFDEWTDVFGSERLTGALLDRLTHHVHILEMNGDSYRLKGSRQNATESSAPEQAGP